MLGPMMANPNISQNLSQSNPTAANPATIEGANGSGQNASEPSGSPPGANVITNATNNDEQSSNPLSAVKSTSNDENGTEVKAASEKSAEKAGVGSESSTIP